MTIPGKGADGLTRFIVDAYVADGEVRKLDGERGSITFNAVYQGRPPEYRYAILRWWSLPEWIWKYGAFDMFHVKRNQDGTVYTPPVPVLVHDSLDAAILATVLLYGDVPCNKV